MYVQEQQSQLFSGQAKNPKENGLSKSASKFYYFLICFCTD